jgi:hypothetical protein
MRGFKGGGRPRRRLSAPRGGRRLGPPGCHGVLAGTARRPCRRPPSRSLARPHDPLPTARPAGRGGAARALGGGAAPGAVGRRRGGGAGGGGGGHAGGGPVQPRQQLVPRICGEGGGCGLGSVQFWAMAVGGRARAGVFARPSGCVPVGGARRAAGPRRGAAAGCVASPTQPAAPSSNPAPNLDLRSETLKNPEPRSTPASRATRCSSWTMATASACPATACGPATRRWRRCRRRPRRRSSRTCGCVGAAWGV